MIGVYRASAQKSSAAHPFVISCIPSILLAITSSGWYFSSDQIVYPKLCWTQLYLLSGVRDLGIHFLGMPWHGLHFLSGQMERKALCILIGFCSYFFFYYLLKLLNQKFRNDNVGLLSHNDDNSNL